MTERWTGWITSNIRGPSTATPTWRCARSTKPRNACGLEAASDALVRQDKKTVLCPDQGSQMKFKLSGPVRWGFWLALHAFLLSASMSSARAQSHDCNHLYGAIRGAAMYCGFFCNQNELLPL